MYLIVIQISVISYPEILSVKTPVWPKDGNELLKHDSVDTRYVQIYMYVMAH